MRRTARGVWLGAAVVALAGVFLAGSAVAAVLAEADLRTWNSPVKRVGGLEVKGRGEAGWRAAHGGNTEKVSQGHLSLDLKSLGATYEEGTLDFVIQRREEKDVEVLFSLLDEKFGQNFGFSIYWEGHMYVPGPEVVLNNQTSHQLWRTWIGARPVGSHATWSNNMPFPKRVGKGRDVRVTVTWGKSPADNAIYIDGVKLKAVTPKGGAEFGAIVRESRWLYIGAGYLKKNAEYYSHMTSVLKEFQLLDEPTLRHQKGSVRIGSVASDASQAVGSSGRLVAGNRLGVRLEGTAGGVGTFDVARLASDRGIIRLNWKGYGVYLDSGKVFFEDGEVDLRQVRRYEVYVSKEPFEAVVEGMVPVETLKVGEQVCVVKDLEVGVPYYAAVVAVMRDRSMRFVLKPKVGLSMVETSAGVYEGAYEVGYADDNPRAVVVGHLSRGKASAKMLMEGELWVDPTLKVEVAASPGELPADSVSTSKVVVTVTDANGDAVVGHRVRFLLATTSQYTGVVGGGQFKDEVGGGMKEELWGETNLFGQVSAEYVAGFAAKTAIIVARDMESNDTGAGYVKSFIQAVAELELYAEEVAAARAGYELTVTSSEAWLTADGRSTANITATLSHPNQRNRPELVEGKRVTFSVSGGVDGKNGEVRVVDGTTDRRGRAYAVYTAGTKIGVVLVTASVQGLSASVQIELRSDAPAKIALSLEPGRLPADGRSTADVHVRVTDINDNPNKGTLVEYAVASGTGKLRRVDEVTDGNGEAGATYVAGKVPGKVSLAVTVRSPEPTKEEMVAARNMALEVPDYRFR